MANFFKDHKEHLFILAGGVLLGIIGTNIYNNSKSTVGFANVGGALSANAGKATNVSLPPNCTSLMTQYNQLGSVLAAAAPYWCGSVLKTASGTDMTSTYNQYVALWHQLNKNCLQAGHASFPSLIFRAGGTTCC